jgi:hypothetical protein
VLLSTPTSYIAKRILCDFPALQKFIQICICLQSMPIMCFALSRMSYNA